MRINKKCVSLHPFMANDYFKFRQFTVRQDRCAMKVGTDGTLLGAWARGGRTVLDIGTGTIGQTRENVAASPFAERIQLVDADIRTLQLSDLGHSPFDAIVANPPYFVDSLECPDDQRTLARHTASLTYGELMAVVCLLLADDGEFSVVIPFDCKTGMEREAALAGLFKVRECAVKTTPRKQPRRYLLAFRKHPATLEMTDGVIETAPNIRSAWYQQLTKDFYL